jgi:cytochrome b561
MPQWKNTSINFGLISRLLHWLMAMALIGLFVLGIIMVELDYYDPWYHTSIETHKAIGVLVAFVLLFRFVWNIWQVKPVPLDPAAKLINRLAELVHWALYGLMFVLVISGYLISTSKGHGIDVFGLFEMPALLEKNDDRGELAGVIHEYTAYLFMFLVVAHAGAALLHHFIFKDETLKRMLKNV